jgi:hypothetical protein
MKFYFLFLSFAFLFTFSAPKNKVEKEKNMYFMLLKSIALPHLRHIHHAFEFYSSFASTTSTKKGGNLYQIKIPTCVDYYVFHLVSSTFTEKGQKGVDNQNIIHCNNNNLKSLSPKPSSIFLQSLELYFSSLLIHPWFKKRFK